MPNREAFASTMNVKLLAKLRELSKETDIPISKLLDKAVQLLIDDHCKG